jgi:tyramine---L-glutamate ligase
MRLFVHEFFCSGAFTGPLCSNPTAREGLAMLRAIVEDFARATGSPVAITLDRRLSGPEIEAAFSERATIHWAASPHEEWMLFQKLTGDADAVFAIVPETNGELLNRRKAVDAVGGRFLGHSAEAILLCSDKLQFANHLQWHGLPTIPTAAFDHSAKESPYPFPTVIKPPDGAGSQDIYLIRNSDGHEALRRQRDSTLGAPGTRPPESKMIVQPFVPGRALSVSAIVHGRFRSPHVFPIGEQRLSDDGRFQYRGGRIPTRLPLPANASELVVAACQSIPGLAGYVGFDLLLTEDGRLVFVEANPRLTTAYLGYRELSRENLGVRILDLGESDEPIAWRNDAVEFTTEGVQR